MAKGKKMAEWIIEIKDGKFPIGKWTELVRCKDCKHYHDIEFVDKRTIKVCVKGIGLSSPEDYCSKGEKRTRWRNEENTNTI